MKTVQKILIDYLKWKQKQLVKVTELGHVLFVKADFDEIKNWSDTHCRNVIRQMLDMAMSGEQVGDADACPWCAEKALKEDISSKCLDCNYRLRHGNCFYPGSTYRLITEGTEAICIMIGKERVYQKIAEMVEQVKKLTAAKK